MFKLDKVIYGNDLDSLVFAYLTGIPIVCENLKYPLPFEYFNSEYDLEILNVSNEKNLITTPDKTIQLNDSKLNVFKKLLFFLSLLGKVKFSQDIKFVSLENPSTLKICSESNKIYHIEFNKLYIINNNLLKDCEHELIEAGKLRVVEKLHIGKALSFRYDLFENKSDFVKNVYMFYQSSMSCIAESFIDKDKVDDLEYSLFYLKYRLMSLFREHGNDFSDAKKLFTPLTKDIYENNIIKYNQSESIKQIKFSTEDYLCQEKNQSDIILESSDAYQLIVAHKFLSMSTQIA